MSEHAEFVLPPQPPSDEKAKDQGPMSPPEQALKITDLAQVGADSFITETLFPDVPQQFLKERLARAKAVRRSDLAALANITTNPEVLARLDQTMIRLGEEIDTLLLASTDGVEVTPEDIERARKEIDNRYPPEQADDTSDGESGNGHGPYL